MRAGADPQRNGRRRPARRKRGVSLSQGCGRPAMTRVRGLRRDAWTIARPYWWSEDRGAASRLLLVVAVLNLGIVYINVLSTSGTTPSTTRCRTGTTRSSFTRSSDSRCSPARQKNRRDDVTLREALGAVGLPELAGRLDETAHWALQLSPGEQQRNVARPFTPASSWCGPPATDPPLSWKWPPGHEAHASSRPCVFLRQSPGLLTASTATTSEEANRPRRGRMRSVTSGI